MRKPFWLMATLGLAGTAAALAAVVCLSSGCSTLGYMAQAVGGHLDVLQRARPVSELLTAAETPEALRERLALSQRLREFAEGELKLPRNDSYRRYADLGRPAAVWNVVAAPELSLTLKTWCFPVTGCVGYRGYYAREAADATAVRLRAEGYEVQVYGVPAYSTLGWSNWVGGDPLLNTFLHWPEAELARLLFHELAHQVVYVADDTTFNESFATAVERLGGERWLAAHGTPSMRAEHVALQQRRAEFRALTLRWRAELDALYRSGLPPEETRRRKAELMAGLRAEYQRVKAERWGGWAGYDGWFAQANNAALGVLAAYHELVPGFEALFERSGRDFDRFYAEVKALAALPSADRRAKLAAAP